MKKKILCIGAGLFNATLASLFIKAGYHIDAIEKESHLGGLCYDYYDKRASCYVSKTGAHILHFSKSTLPALHFLKKEVNLIPYEHKVLCIGNGNISYFPINSVYKDLFRYINPKSGSSSDSIEKEFIESYSRKMWGDYWPRVKNNITSRYKVKKSLCNSFFENEEPFLPAKGYSNMIKSLLGSSTVLYNTLVNFHSLLYAIKNKDYAYIFISAPIDEFFSYKYGKLQYAGLNFDFKAFISNNNILPTAVLNTNKHKKIIRIVEYNQLCRTRDSRTKLLCFESSSTNDNDKHYPILDSSNQALYSKYSIELEKLGLNSAIFFTGRLGQYKYFDMDDTILEAMKLYDRITKNI